ncbi:hypothetical protein [Aquimarina sp. AU474]|uniref:hypothetical protein n=1 Tax=Aquimarina sp. AU474 TaxID=2108529 RepID=UPI000D69150D|nr:hypothetical protein [Aquimarina sp. AU474]
MSKMNITLILFCLLIGHISAQDIVNLPELDQVHVDVDTIIKKNEYLLKVDIDTLFVINKVGLLEYNNCINSYSELLDKCKEYDEVGSIINTISFEFDSLTSNIKSLESKYELSLMENIKNNKLLREENQLISKSLVKTKEHLDSAKLKLKRERWNVSGKKILWGAGGLIIGVLVGGSLIANN